MVLDSQKLVPASEITCLHGTSSGNDLQKDEKSKSEWPAYTPWTALCCGTNEFGTATWRTQRLRWEATQTETEMLKTMLQKFWDVNIKEYDRSRIRTYQVQTCYVYFLPLIVIFCHSSFCAVSSSAHSLNMSLQSDPCIVYQLSSDSYCKHFVEHPNKSQIDYIQDIDPKRLRTGK